MPDFNLYLGNCLDILRDLPAESVDSIVTDPPYGLTQNKKGGTGSKSVNLNNPAGRSRISTGNGAGGFMGKKWDSDVPSTEIWAECLRVLKPSGNLLCFAGTRTQHRMVARVVEAGFAMKDAVLWAYGCLSEDTEVLTKDGWVLYGDAIGKAIQVYDIVTKECKWEIPSQWYVYHVEDDVAYNLRSEDTDQVVSKGHRCLIFSGDSLGFTFSDELRGEEVIPVFDGHRALNKSKVTVSKVEYSGVFWCPTVSTGAFVARRNGKVFITGNSGFPKSHNIEKAVQKIAPEEASRFQGTGTSIKPAHEIISIYTKLPGDFNLHNEFKRLYYCAKASKRERNLGLVDRVSTHPTIKPLKLMKQLCELATPKGGTILDPFMGSGTTGLAALSSGFDFIGIDITPEYFEIASFRLNSIYPQSK